MLRLPLAALAAGCALALASGPALAQGKGMVFAVQEAGTAFYTIGSGIAKLLGEKLDRRVAVQPYSGSSVYLPLLDSGEATLGFSSTMDASDAYKGTDRKAMKELRTVARIWPLRVGLMVRADAGIKTVADLKGKRVTIDLRGQRAMANVVRAMLATGGLKDADVRNVPVANVGAGAKSLIEGDVDAAFIAVGIPLVKQAHSAISGGVAYVDMGTGDDHAKIMASVAPGTYPAKLDPAPHLPEVKASIHTPAFDIMLLTGAKTPDADVTAIAKALHEGFAELQKDYPQLRAGDAKLLAAPSNTAPYHPGAIAYYKAQGLWTPENEAREKEFK
jgi:TRAP transporter TAXI family solute receptor